MSTAFEPIRERWPKYLMEAWGLGTFMVSACIFGAFIFHPDSYFAGYDVSARNVPMGLAMGLTAIAIFRSPWGKRSGAHINPAVTLMFYRLGRIGAVDAVCYSLAHFAGAILGVLLSWLILGDVLADPGVRFVPTVPGNFGEAGAFAGEFIISLVLTSAILFASENHKFGRFTPFLAGALVAIYIALESPLSGMSMNPARTFASAIVGNIWTGWWIYFTAPPLAMLTSAEIFLWTRRSRDEVLCITDSTT